jgi:signal transduction histidine kinase
MKTTDIRTAEEARRLQEHLQSGRYKEFAGQWKHRTKDGRILDVEITRRRLDYAGRKANLAIAQDITERKKLEVDLRQAQKLEAVGRLASGIAHEINTPIQFVGDNLRFLQDAFASLGGLLEKYQEIVKAATQGREEMQRAAAEADLEYLLEETPKALNQSLEGVARVATIVKAMKDFAHPEQNHKMAANLNQALTSTLVVARNELKYVADVETDFGDIPPVKCHLGDLNQVFLNLLINAAHAIAEVVDGTGEKGTIRVHTRQSGERVRIAISDTGCGIPEKIRAKIFDPFFTTKPVGRGTGQGLAISRSIVVDKHGGMITFESEVGRGTTFVIELPISDEGE